MILNFFSRHRKNTGLCSIRVSQENCVKMNYKKSFFRRVQKDAICINERIDTDHYSTKSIFGKNAERVSTVNPKTNKFIQ